MAKIDLSGLKAGLGSLKSYSAMLWPVVIVLGGVLVMTAALLIGRSFRAKVNRESIPLGTQVKTFVETAIPEARIAIKKQYEDAYEQDANSIEKLLIESTQRELLSYAIFPKPTDTSAMIFTGFSRKYRQSIEQLAAKVNGRDCPSEEELKGINQQGAPGAGLWSSSPAMRGKIMEEFYQARARSASVYVNPSDIAGYIFWENYQYKNLETGVTDCWYWQLGYWIIEDVFSTVEAMNAGSTSVWTSPLKRIENVGFVLPEKLFGTGAKTVDQTKPKYVIKPEDQLTEACTGRVSNDDVNIVQFSVVVVTDTKAILPFMEKLCSVKEHKWRGFSGQEPEQALKHNQITILESRVKPISTDDPIHQKYRYGPDPVAEVELICEYVFNKKGYEAINPEMQKKEGPANPEQVQQ
jgi:hypothetical protein